MAAALALQPDAPPLQVGPCPHMVLTMAEAVAPMAGLSIQARRLLLAGQRTTDFLQTLVDDEIHIDAINVLAFALDRISGIIWAYECVRQHLGDAANPEERGTLEAALDWLKDPGSDELRREAMVRAETLGPRNSASWVGISVFWSGGSIAPADCPPVEPRPELLGTAVKSALHIATAESEPRTIPQVRLAILRQGVMIANRPVDPPA